MVCRSTQLASLTVAHVGIGDRAPRLNDVRVLTTRRKDVVQITATLRL
jgi:hypothetical protein